MTCHKSRPSKFLAAITIFGFAFCGVTSAGERDDLYEDGLKSYESKNYTVALKKLYAFYVLNEENIDEHPEFKNALLKRISESESVLNLSYLSNKSSALLDNGRIRIITGQPHSFEGSGREIEELLNSKEIDVESIQIINRDTLTMPSNER